MNRAADELTGGDVASATWCTAVARTVSSASIPARLEMPYSCNRWHPDNISPIHVLLLDEHTSLMPWQLPAPEPPVIPGVLKSVYTQQSTTTKLQIVHVYGLRSTTTVTVNRQRGTDMNCHQPPASQPD